VCHLDILYHFLPDNNIFTTTALENRADFVTIYLLPFSRLFLSGGTRLCGKEGDAVIRT